MEVWVLAFAGFVLWFVVTGRVGMQRNRSISSAPTNKEIDHENDLTTGAPVQVKSERPDHTELDDPGQQSASENGMFTVSWWDGAVVNGTYLRGFRSEGRGRLILKAAGNVAWQSTLERPKNGTVANNGYVAVEDSLFGSGLKGVFYVFSPQGEIIIRHQVASMLRRSGIFPDGHFAWCTTAASRVARDSRKFYLFSIFPPRLALKCDELVGFPVALERRDDAFELTTNTGIFYRISHKGFILNKKEVEESIDQYRIRSGQPWMLLEAVEHRMKDRSSDAPDPERARALLELLDEAAEDSHDDKTLARIERSRGEILLAAGNKPEALQRFLLALAIERNVSVERIVQRLEKELREAGTVRVD